MAPGIELDGSLLRMSLDDGLVSAVQSSEAPHAESSAQGQAQASDSVRTDARARRIAAAVERSRTEYKPEHAYTERGWFTGTVAGPSKVDRQHVEYSASWRLAGGGRDGGETARSGNDDLGAVSSTDVVAEAARALADVLACAAPRPLKSLPRELLGTGVSAAVACGDAVHALNLARAARGYWRAYVGLAVTCSDALKSAGELKESIHPLIYSTASALHYPVLVRLSERLQDLVDGQEANSSAAPHEERTDTAGTSDPADPVVALAAAVTALAVSREWAFSTPLFDTDDETTLTNEAETPASRARGPPPPPANAAAHRAALSALDVPLLATQLGLAAHADGPKLLTAALARLARALGGRDDEPEVVPGERVERGVREL